MSLFYSLLIAMTLNTSAGAVELEAILPNKRGISELKDGNAYLAFQRFAEAVNESPYEPAVHLNLGLAFLENKENEKALAEFQVADQLAQNQPELKFAARFNQGVILGQSGQIEAALNAYQAALEIAPDSKETKTNIELLWKQDQQNKGGGGKGEQKQDPKDDKKDGQGQQDQKKEDQQDQKPENEKKQQPKPFDSKDLSQETVRKILDELKAQEQRVRADDYSRGAKEMPHEKDW